MKHFHKKTVLRIAVAAAAAIAVSWLWPREDADAGGVEPANQPRIAKKEPSALPGAGKPPKGSAPEFGTPEFTPLSLERCAKWMESRGRDAASLVALWDLSGDENLLLEAAEKFPDDPRVCAAMIGHLRADSKALPWAERLMMAESGNPAGFYWKATLLAEAGDPKAALEALSAATKVKGKPDSHLRDRMITVREAALASGGSVRQTAMAAYVTFLSKDLLPMMSGKTFGVVKNAIREAKDTGDPDRAADVAALGAAAAEHLRYNSAPTIIDDLTGQGMLLMTLKELPPETEYGNSGKTAGERLAEIEADRAETRKLVQSDGAQRNPMALTDGQFSEYTDRLILHGEAAAFRWMDGILSNKAVRAK